MRMVSKGLCAGQIVLTQSPRAALGSEEYEFNRKGRANGKSSNESDGLGRG